MPSSHFQRCLQADNSDPLGLNSSKNSFSDCIVADDFVLMGGYHKSQSNTSLIVAAIGHQREVFQYVNTEGQTNYHNGVYWYRYCCSIGFSPTPTTVIHFTDKSTDQPSKRISWDINSHYVGYRIGSNLEIHEGQFWKTMHIMRYRLNCANYSLTQGCITCDQGFYFGLYDLCYCKYQFSDRCKTCTGAQSYWRNDGNCDCNDGFYYSRNQTNPQTCTACQHRCLKCVDSPTNCLQCRYTNQITLVNGSCLCNQRFFDTGSLNSYYCSSCDNNCATCSMMPTNCTSCSDPNSQLSNNQCVCKDGYFKMGSGQIFCYPCDNNCGTCSIISTNCTSCNDTNSFLKNSRCGCNHGYFEAGNAKQFCFKCDNNCETCELQSTRCLTCSDPNSQWNNFKCECIDRFYQKGVQQIFCFQCDLKCGNCSQNPDNCTTCLDPNSQLSPQNRCECLDPFYEGLPNQTNFCLKCRYRCSSCENPLTCTQCSGLNREFNFGQCTCALGHYDDFQNADCLPCSSNCRSCSNGLSCTQCANSDRVLPLCNCIDGQYEQFPGSPCYPCQQYCKTCNDSQTCFSCSGINRNASNQCNCYEGYSVNLINKECEFCDDICRMKFQLVNYRYNQLDLNTLMVSLIFNKDLFPKEILEEEIRLNFNSLTRDDYNLTISIDTVHKNEINVRIEFKTSFINENMEIGINSENGIQDVYSKPLDLESGQKSYDLPVQPVLQGENALKAKQTFESLNQAANSVQQSKTINSLKYLSIIDMLVNSQAITNLLLPNFYFTSNCYEFMRLLGLSTYPRMPAWNFRSSQQIYNETYSLNPQIINLHLSSSMKTQLTPSYFLFQQMGFASSFLINSFNFFFIYLVIGVVFIIFNKIYKQILNNNPGKEEEIEESVFKTIYNAINIQFVLQIETNQGRLILYFLIQCKDFNFNQAISYFGVIFGILYLVGFFVFSKYVVRFILQNDCSFITTKRTLGIYSPLLADINYNKYFQKFEGFSYKVSSHFFRAIYRYRAMYHVFGLYKKIIVTTLIFVLLEEQEKLIIILILIQSFVLLITLLLRPLLYIIQNILKILQEIFLLIIYIQTYLVYLAYQKSLNSVDQAQIREYIQKSDVLLYFIYSYLILLLASWKFSIFLLISDHFKEKNRKKTIEQLMDREKDKSDQTIIISTDYLEGMINHQNHLQRNILNPFKRMNNSYSQINSSVILCNQQQNLQTQALDNSTNQEIALKPEIKELQQQDKDLFGKKQQTQKKLQAQKPQSDLKSSLKMREELLRDKILNTKIYQLRDIYRESQLVQSIDKIHHESYEMNPYNQDFQIVQQSSADQETMHSGNKNVILRKIVLTKKSFCQQFIMNSPKYYNRLVTSKMMILSNYEMYQYHGQDYQIYRSESSKVVLGHLHVYYHNLNDKYHLYSVELQEIYCQYWNCIVKIKYKAPKELILCESINNYQEKLRYDPQDYPFVTEQRQQNLFSYQHQYQTKKSKTQPYAEISQDFKKLISRYPSKNNSNNYILISYSIEMHKILKHYDNLYDRNDPILVPPEQIIHEISLFTPN